MTINPSLSEQLAAALGGTPDANGNIPQTPPPEASQPAPAEPVDAGSAVTWPAFDVPAGSSATIVFTADIAPTVIPAVYNNDVTATAANATIPALLQTAPVTVTLPGLTVVTSGSASSLRVKYSIAWRARCPP